MNAAKLLKSLQRKVLTVEVEDMGEFNVTGLTVSEFLDVSQHAENQDLFFATAIAHGVLDEKGEKLFKQEDIEVLAGSSNVNFTMTLGSKILELSNMVVEDVKK